MGLVIHHAAARNKRSEAGFWIYLLVIVLAMVSDWRWRPTTTVVGESLHVHRRVFGQPSCAPSCNSGG
jgi:hypothetical protein